jgi:AraC-like DNA-binding protein
MLSPGPGSAPVRFSTRRLPERQRVPIWCEAFGRQVVRVNIEPLSDHPFAAEATVRALLGLRSMTFVGSPARNERPANLIADGDDAVVLLVNVTGTLTASQRGRDVSLGRGDSTLLLHAEASALTHSHVHYRGLIVPRAPLAALVTHVEDAAMRLIPHADEGLRLLMSYLKAVWENPEPERPALQHLIATHVCDLVAMIIGASRDGVAIAKEGGVAAARLAAIKTDIIRNAGHPDLTLLAVAKRQSVTPRTIQRLFESDGATFSAFVLGQRLARGHRMLADKRYAAWTIGAIAFAAGFGDLSYFHRVFRRRYGATPSEIRAESS